MKNTTVGVFNDHVSAESALNELKQFGVPDGDLSYIYTNSRGTIKDAQTGDKIATGAAAGLTAGAVIGGLAGLAVANGILPGMGSLLVAGPLAAYLGFGGATAAGLATGAVAGGLLGGLTNIGIDSKDAELYKKHIESGHIVVIARATPSSTVSVFNNAGASEVRQYTTE